MISATVETVPFSESEQYLCSECLNSGWDDDGLHVEACPYCYQRCDIEDAYERSPAGRSDWRQPIECAYCQATEGLRRLRDGYWEVPPEYICEACFTGQDDGPCFDDLPEVK